MLPYYGANCELGSPQPTDSTLASMGKWGRRRTSVLAYYGATVACVKGETENDACGTAALTSVRLNENIAIHHAIWRHPSYHTVAHSKCQDAVVH